MTNEQREAIEYIQKQIDYFKEQIKFIEAVDCDYYEEEYELYKNRIKQFSTVLSLIKEQQEEIENLKNKEVLIKRYFKKCDLIKQKDNQIDLMAEKLAKAYHYKMNECSLKKKELNNIDCNKYKDCTSCIKQYFADKAKMSQ